MVQGLYTLVPPASNDSVYILKESGKKVSSGELQLAPSSCLVLGPDCHNAEFQGTEFKGVHMLGNDAEFTYRSQYYLACGLLFLTSPQCAVC